MNNYNKMNTLTLCRSEFIDSLSAEIFKIKGSDVYSNFSSLDVNRLFRQYQNQQCSIKVFVKSCVRSINNVNHHKQAQMVSPEDLDVQNTLLH